ncbi:MAG TPA: hypothetical protein VM143_07085 [Acidimicrobiales bacterium]|nr:hypothetical protein [Acidimicrobiales bacterium]
MTIIDFPTKGRVGRAWPRSRHPTVAVPAAPRRAGGRATPIGSPPTGRWLDAYEELAACCAEVVATAPPRLYDAEWDDLLSWIRSRLAALDDLKAPGVS